VTHCFVNLGSDHPSIIEAIVKGQNEKKGQFPRIITCTSQSLSSYILHWLILYVGPNEMVALSMADGYARLTNKPQAVIVHVDVGTQGLGAAIHNASCGRAPVLIFAGLSPVTIEGEYRGSRTEYIHWIQDVPDQRAIVAQYCRYAAEVKRGRNVKQMVNRALSFATSEPRGPVYLLGSREAMEEDIEPYAINQQFWTPAELGGLSIKQLESVSKILVDAEEPLLITGYSGRNHQCVGALVELADTIKGLRVLDTGGSDMCFPANHPAWLGLRYGVEEAIKTADVIIVLDCDVPWIPTQCKPKSSAKIIHIDVDTLKQQMPVFYIDAVARYRVDAETAVRQITQYIQSTFKDKIGQTFDKRWSDLQQSHKKRLDTIAAQAQPGQDGTFGTSYLIQQVRKAVPKDTIFAVEAVTNAGFVSDQVQATAPGTWINCGGGGLGWSGGGALGVKLATDHEAGGSNKGKFVCQIVGDGTYLFSVPGSVYWIAERYGIPVLVIVLNNQGMSALRYPICWACTD
jgi:thiamine pyrophosphate-dependent acetolactate synthase large subunit-like protein